MKYFIIVAIVVIIIGVTEGILKVHQEHKEKQSAIEKQRQAEIARLEEAHKKERERRESAEKAKARNQARLREEARQKEIHEQAEIARKNRSQEKKDSFEQLLNSLTKYNIVLSGEKHNRNASLYIECKNMTKATPVNKIKDFVAVDTETTGLKTSGNDVVQLSAVKFTNFEPVELFSTYIKPRKSIPEEASSINGITDDMVEDAPRFYQIINSFNEFIGDLPLVAHNAPFDMKHLYVNGLDSVENKTVYDTLDLSKKIIKDAYSYKLQDICEEADIYFDDAHNSNSDSLAAGLLFVYLCAERRELTVKELIDMVN